VEDGNKVLANHFANGPRNATYRSKTIQNEIIEVLGTYIQDKIVAEINEAGAFSLLADEASDSSNEEQLPLIQVCRQRKKCQRRIRWVLRVSRRRHWSSYSHSCNEGRSRPWLVYGLLQGTVL